MKYPGRPGYFMPILLRRRMFEAVRERDVWKHGNINFLIRVEQIKKKRYSAKYAASGKRVLLFGVNFKSEKRQIDDWRVESFS